MQAGHTPCLISQGGMHALILQSEEGVVSSYLCVQKTIHEVW